MIGFLFRAWIIRKVIGWVTGSSRRGTNGPSRY
jgi:hypothetical protein